MWTWVGSAIIDFYLIVNWLQLYYAKNADDCWCHLTDMTSVSDNVVLGLYKVYTRA